MGHQLCHLLIKQTPLAPGLLVDVTGDLVYGRSQATGTGPGVLFRLGQNRPSLGRGLGKWALEQLDSLLLHEKSRGKLATVKVPTWAAGNRTRAIAFEIVCARPFVCVFLHLISLCLGECEDENPSKQTGISGHRQHVKLSGS